MVGTIGPLVYGRAPRRARAAYLTLFAASSAAGGAVVGSLLAVPSLLACGRPPIGRQPASLCLLGLSLVGLMVESGLLAIRFPMSTWQVPRHWARLPTCAMLALYGLFLGAGVLTRIKSFRFYILIFASLIYFDPSLPVACFALFGLSKSLPVILVTRGHVLLDRGDSSYFLRTVELERFVRPVSGVALIVFSAIVMATLFFL
jgi:hypothetical protein